MAYIELEDLRSYRGLESTETTDNNLLQGAIEAAQSYIESQTHRLFESTAGTRFYMRGALSDDDRTVLCLNQGCLTVTELLNADASSTEITAANYWLLDRNLGPPYHWIKLYSDTGVYWEFDPDMWVEVTGTWGYSATPPGDIVEACLELAAFAYAKKDSQVFDTTAIPEAGVIVIPAGIPASVRLIIEAYKRYI